MLGPVLMTILESSKFVASVFRNSTMLWRDEPPLLEDPAWFSLLPATDALALASPLALWSADFLSFFWWTDSRNAVTPPFLHVKIRYVYPGSRTQIFLSMIQDPKDSDPGSASKNLSTAFLTQKIVSKLSVIWYGMFIPDPGSGVWFFPFRIPDSVVKKTSNPGSGSATLKKTKQIS